jgi:hypothetical protein
MDMLDYSPASVADSICFLFTASRISLKFTVLLPLRSDFRSRYRRCITGNIKVVLKPLCILITGNLGCGSLTPHGENQFQVVKVFREIE